MPAMISVSPFVRACVGLLCLAIFVMRVGGEHLHVCLDGGQPLVAVYLAADTEGSERANSAGKPHHDLDLSLSGDALAKKFDNALMLPALLFAGILLFVIRLLSSPIIPRFRERPFQAVPLSRFRPPLRAPPL